jgi:hypothetical protein
MYLVDAIFLLLPNNMGGRILTQYGRLVWSGQLYNF